MQKLYINHEHISFIKKKNKIPKTKYRRKTKILHSSNPDVALINLYSQNLKSLIPASLIFIPERGRLHSLPVLRRLPVAAVSCLQRKQEIRSPQRLHGGIRRLEMREMRRERSHPMPALLNKKKKKKRKKKKRKKNKTRNIVIPGNWHREESAALPLFKTKVLREVYRMLNEHVTVGYHVLARDHDYSRSRRACLQSLSLSFPLFVSFNWKGTNRGREDFE